MHAYCLLFIGFTRPNSSQNQSWWHALLVSVSEKQFWNFLNIGFLPNRGPSRRLYWPSRPLGCIIFHNLSNDTNFVPIRYLSKKLWSKYWRESGWCCPSVRMVVFLLHTISIIRSEHPDHWVWRPYGWTSSARLTLLSIVSGQEYHIV